ncbi:MAG: hypothetical protein F6K14_25015 [Symploca sp. SIO2C1]|nr:hypothetical protein [Symploca sp. SIO2C1]
MADREVKLVGGFGHSYNQDDPNIITNIGPKGTSFSGTFTGRSGYFGFDFIASVYTDKDDVLYIVYQAGDDSMQIIRESPQSFEFKLKQGYPIGTISYDSSSGNLTIRASGSLAWFQGTISGMYVYGG